MSIGGRIQDRKDGEKGTILREIGSAVFSTLMDNGEVCYFARRRPAQDSPSSMTNDRACRPSTDRVCSPGRVSIKTHSTD